MTDHASFKEMGANESRSKADKGRISENTRPAGIVPRAAFTKGPSHRKSFTSGGREGR